MQIEHKKNTAYYLAFPMIDSSTPASFKTGLSPTDTAYYKDGAGAWTSLAIADTASEIASTGVYEIDLASGELNHDQVIIKFTSAGAADTAFLFDMRTNSISDLNLTASGNIGIDWANVENPSTAVDFAATDIQLCDTVSTLTGHTVQTGDSFTRLGAPAGASVSVDVAAIKADTAASAAWGAINSGIVFRGPVSADDPGVSFTIGGLAGQGVGAFVDANTPWYAYVFRDAGGAAAAPQGEIQKVTGYTSATGLFTTDAFTVPVATGDDVIIMSGRIAAIPEILADTNELQTNQGNWLTATGFSTHSAADVVNEWETQSQADPTGFHVNVLEWSGTAVTTSSTSTKPEVDLFSLSDDATAANNLETMLDGTGGQVLSISSLVITGAATGISVTGTTAGVAISGGTTGVGLDINGGSSSGVAVDIDSTSGSAVDITSADATGLKVLGVTHGLEIAASGGDGIEIDGTTRGIRCDASNGVGVSFVGTTQGFYVAGNTQDILANISGDLSGSVGSVTGSVGSVTGHTAQTGDSFARLGAPAGASVSADILAIAGYVDTEVAAIKAVTDLLPDAGALTTIGTDTARLTAARAAVLTDWINGGRLDLLLDAVKAVTDALTAAAATKLAASAGQIIIATVDTATNSHTPTTTEFQADDITEATADHYNGRIVIFTSGALAGQATDITDYVAVGGIGQFTVTAMTEAPANNDTFVIV